MKRVEKEEQKKEEKGTRARDKRRSARELADK